MKKQTIKINKKFPNKSAKNFNREMTKNLQKMTYNQKKKIRKMINQEMNKIVVSKMKGLYTAKKRMTSLNKQIKKTMIYLIVKLMLLIKKIYNKVINFNNQSIIN